MNQADMITTDERMLIGNAINCASRIVAAEIAHHGDSAAALRLKAVTEHVIAVIKQLQAEVCAERKTRTDGMVDNAMATLKPATVGLVEPNRARKLPQI